MSVDLVVPSNINGSAQVVQDQNNDSSILYLSSTNVGVNQPNPVATLDVGGNVALNDNPLSLRGATDPYHIIGYTSTGDTDYWTFNTQLLIQSGPNTSPTTIATFTQKGMTVNGSLTFPGIKPASQAPNVANLASVVVDTTTGIFYTL
jgi:hypothetical protein